MRVTHTSTAIWTEEGEATVLGLKGAQGIPVQRPWTAPKLLPVVSTCRALELEMFWARVCGWCDASHHHFNQLTRVFGCRGKSPAAMGKWRSDRRGDAGSRSYKPTCRRSRTLVACCWIRRQQQLSAAPWTTEQPYLGAHCSPHSGKGLEKVS